MAKKNKKNDDPPWMDPANDRKTPYTEEELELFAEGFINDNIELWETLVKSHGQEAAVEKVKEGFRRKR